MDEKQVRAFNGQENAIPTDLDGTNIPAITASLEMLTVDTNCTPPMETKRVLRKRIPKPRLIPTETPKRRCSLRPKKRTISEMTNLKKDIEEYYLNKSVKKPNNLETIYEESDNANDDFVYMGAKRLKRMLLFKSEPTTSKLKKRRMKIQKVFGSKIYNKKRASMQTLLDKLDGIRVNSPVKIDNELK